MSRGTHWLEVDHERLRVLWRDPTVGKAAIARTFGRSIGAIDQKATELKLGRRPRLVWIGKRPEPLGADEWLRREVEAAKAEAPSAPLYRRAEW